MYIHNVNNKMFSLHLSIHEGQKWNGRGNGKVVFLCTYLKLGLGETVMAETEQGTEAQKHAAAPPKTQKRRREENDKHIAELFHLLDIDRSGGISLRELVTGLSGPKVVEMIQKFEPLKFLLHPAEVEETFKKMDVGEHESSSEDEEEGNQHKKIDMDGMISFYEFRQFCMNVIHNYAQLHRKTDVSIERAIEILKIDPVGRGEHVIEELTSWIMANPSTQKFFLKQKVPEDILHEVIRQAQFHEVSAGEFVFEQGDLGPHYYVIMKGCVEIFVRSPKDQDLEMSMHELGEHRNAMELKHTGRLGMQVRELYEGDGFGEIALLSTIGTRRTASVIVPEKWQEHIEGLPRPRKHNGEPTLFFTLTRSVYQRLFKAQNTSSDISEKVQVLMDSFMFSWWPRSQIVQFAINCEIVRIKKHEYFLRSGQEAEHMYLIASGEVKELQPIYMRGAAAKPGFQRPWPGNGRRQQPAGMRNRRRVTSSERRVIFPWDWEVLKTKIKPSDTSWQMEKMNVGVGLKGTFDLVGQLPMVKKVPYYLKDVKALTNVVAIKICMRNFYHFLMHTGLSSASAVASHISSYGVKGKGNQKSLLHHMDSLSNALEPQEYALNTLEYLKATTERFDEFRIQRVKAAVDSDGLITPCTKEMQRRHNRCGRCGKLHHSFGELDLFGKHVCPLMNMDVKKKGSKPVATKKGVARPTVRTINWKKRSPGAPSYSRTKTESRTEKRQWAGKQGSVDRFAYFLDKMSTSAPAKTNAPSPKAGVTVGGSRSLSKYEREQLELEKLDVHNIADNTRVRQSFGINNNKRMLVLKTKTDRLRRKPKRPPLSVRVHSIPSGSVASPRAMRAIKLRSMVEHGTLDDVQAILLKRQVTHYIMPKDVTFNNNHFMDEEEEDFHHDHGYT